MTTFMLTSPAFQHADAIPAKYTCDAQDISPRFNWGDPPQGTQSFVLIFDDPEDTDGTWVHWVLFNIPATARELPESILPADQLPGEAAQGNNSWQRLGYAGPCPPTDTHHYSFRLYALDVLLDLPSGATKAQVMAAAASHILASSELIGAYKRR